MLFNFAFFARLDLLLFKLVSCFNLIAFAFLICFNLHVSMCTFLLKLLKLRNDLEQNMHESQYSSRFKLLFEFDRDTFDTDEEICCKVGNDVFNTWATVVVG